MLTTEIRRQREAHLPKAPNGSPIACSDPYAAQVLKDMGQGRSQEVARLRAVLRCNRRDGVPIAAVTRPLYLLLADLEAEAALEASAAAHRPLGPIMRLETKRQTDVDLAQLAVMAEPDSPEANRALLIAVEQYRPTLDTLYTRAKLVVVRGATRRVAGARRGSLQLHA